MSLARKWHRSGSAWAMDEAKAAPHGVAHKSKYLFRLDLISASVNDTLSCTSALWLEILRFRQIIKKYLHRFVAFYDRHRQGRGDGSHLSPISLQIVERR